MNQNTTHSRLYTKRNLVVSFDTFVVIVLVAVTRLAFLAHHYKLVSGGSRVVASVASRSNKISGATTTAADIAPLMTSRKLVSNATSPTAAD